MYKKNYNVNRKHQTDQFQQKDIFCEGADQPTKSINDDDESNKNEESHRQGQLIIHGL